MNQTQNSADGYLAAWEATADLVESGHNWSGNERNVAFLNTRDGRFAGVTAGAWLWSIGIMTEIWISGSLSALRLGFDF
jgi:hypothetical protein